MTCHHYRVEGRVQGVFFRASTRDKAIEIGLQGWVRNLSDGRVEALACGTEQQLATLEAWLHKGPPMASVTRLEKEVCEVTEEYSDFYIR